MKDSKMNIVYKKIMAGESVRPSDVDMDNETFGGILRNIREHHRAIELVDVENSDMEKCVRLSPRVIDLIKNAAHIYDRCPLPRFVQTAKWKQKSAVFHNYRRIGGEYYYDNFYLVLSAGDFTNTKYTHLLTQLTKWHSSPHPYSMQIYMENGDTYEITDSRALVHGYDIIINSDDELCYHLDTYGTVNYHHVDLLYVRCVKFVYESILNQL